MERGIYCHNWGRGMHNMHPSMPIHSKALIEDLKKLRGTMVCWASMGGGSISLPYLENEANGDVPPRMLYHGYMNDGEYIKHCREAGIDIFAVFYEAQGWEVPVVLSEDGKSFRQMNVVDEAEEYDWYGLTEFTQDKHWEVFGKKFSDYFPEGLTNSDGEKVTDLFEECVTRNVQGEAIHANWVEVSSMPQRCHLTCRNNPVWVQYINKAIEIMIDNGARGIQLDETETPITSFRYSGCFCKDCMKKFRSYLQKHKDMIPTEYSDIDLSTFNYAKFLDERGVVTNKDMAEAPLFEIYWRFLIESNNEALQEVLKAARAYADSKELKIRISGNIFNLYLYNYPSWGSLDLMVTELDNTLFKRHDWFRYAAGVTGDKPVIVAENPYGGMIPEFLDQLKKGKAYDLFRIFLMEAAMHGISMCVPYGGWMGSEIPDAFYPPLDVAIEVQNFIADNEEIFGRKSGANVKIFYGFESYMSREPLSGFDKDLFWDTPEDLLSYRVKSQDDSKNRMLFWEAAQVMQKSRSNYDVDIFPDGSMVTDAFSESKLVGYDLVILPGCSILTPNQAGIIKKYAMSGGRVILYGKTAENISGWEDTMREIPSVTIVEECGKISLGKAAFEKSFVNNYNTLRTINWNSENVVIQCTEHEKSTVIHAINYSYNLSEDKIENIEKLVIKYKTSDLPKSIKPLTLDGIELEFSYKKEDEWLVIEVYNMPVYIALVLDKQ